MDFTLEVYSSLLTILLDSGYLIMPVSDFSGRNKPEKGRQLFLRHDVDRHTERSLAIAEIERNMRIVGTYYFRAIPGSFDHRIIREIASLGHEIGYHYEDLDLAGKKSKALLLQQTIRGQENRESPSFARTSKSKEIKHQMSRDEAEKYLATLAFNSFRDNLAGLRAIAPVHTICMHGSPLSGYDSRLIWKYFDYGELGIENEPYFDISLDDMLYLTDTGRRWDGSAVSIRDRVYLRDEQYFEQWVRKPVPGSAMAMTVQGEQLQKKFRFRKTTDIMNSAKTDGLPGLMLLTVHPQRWSNSLPACITELVIQNLKNTAKYIINKWHIE